MEQRRQHLYLAHRVVGVPLRFAVGARRDGGPIGQGVGRTRAGGAEIAEAGEGECEPPRVRRRERTGERHAGAGGISDRVRIRRIRGEPGQRDVVAVDDLAAQAVGIGELGGAEETLAGHRRTERDLWRHLGLRRRPRDGHFGRWISAPCEVDLFGNGPRTQRTRSGRAGCEGVAVGEAQIQGRRGEPRHSGELHELATRQWWTRKRPSLRVDSRATRDDHVMESPTSPPPDPQILPGAAGTTLRGRFRRHRRRVTSQ